MICGNCKNRHDHVSEVKACYRATTPPRNVTSNQVAYANGVRRPTPVAVEKPRDGFYTVVFSHGDWITIRLRTQDANDSFAPGETIASYLDGPDNESDYRGFAFVKDDGRFFLWKRFRDSGGRLGRALEILMSDPEEAGETYAIESGRCRRCNRKLTVPASIHRGFGPVCADEVGV